MFKPSAIKTRVKQLLGRNICSTVFGARLLLRAVCGPKEKIETWPFGRALDSADRKICPHRSGVGRASGALAFELVNSARTSSSHIALLGGALILAGAQDVVAAGPLGRAF